ncbi:hypothetical protein M6I34_06130 [Burkholderiaceae bacterium FT117]|uniref:hypothetical protein n=1 Tax=Zeimonas sediminis TaxID=2944268 RepID=UPI002342EDED|nr:hypothetical protein [Zeimonas sediminis]MCM5570079.1 hypothetical protein [Zeimonas sediminis]
MKTFVTFVLGLLIGGGAMLLLAPAAVGVGAGAGIVTGMKAGACLTVEAAKDAGLITAEQVDQVLRAASIRIGASGSGDAASQGGSGDAECRKLLAELASGVEK